MHVYIWPRLFFIGSGTAGKTYYGTVGQKIPSGLPYDKCYHLPPVVYLSGMFLQPSDVDMNQPVVAVYIFQSEVLN